MKNYSIIQAPIFAFFSTQFYRELGTSGKGVAFLYLLIVLALSNGALAIKEFPEFHETFLREAEPIADQMPEIRLKDGSLSINQESPWVITDGQSGQVVIAFDTRQNLDGKKQGVRQNRELESEQAQEDRSEAEQSRKQEHGQPEEQTPHQAQEQESEPQAQEQEPELQGQEHGPEQQVQEQESELQGQEHGPEQQVQEQESELQGQEHGPEQQVQEQEVPKDESRGENSPRVFVDGNWIEVPVLIERDGMAFQSPLGTKHCGFGRLNAVIKKQDFMGVISFNAVFLPIMKYLITLPWLWLVHIFQALLFSLAGLLLARMIGVRLPYEGILRIASVALANVVILDGIVNLFPLDIPQLGPMQIEIPYWGLYKFILALGYTLFGVGANLSPPSFQSVADDAARTFPQDEN